MDEDAIDRKGSDPPKEARYGSSFAPMSARVIVGIVLIFFGIDLLIELATGVDVQTVAAGLGAGFLLFWRTSRGYVWLVAGSVLLGVGLGNAFSPLVAPVLERSFERLLLAGGFALIPILDSRKRSNWAWIPAFILGLLAVTGLAVDIDELIIPEVATVLLPVLAIVAGTVLLFRDRLSSAAFKATLALTVAIGIAVASVSGFFDADIADIVVDRGRSHSETKDFEIPALEGRRLLVTTKSGSIKITSGALSGRAIMYTRDTDRSRAEERLSDADVKVVETAQLVRLSVDDPDVTIDFEISLPQGSDIQMAAGSGDVELDAGGLGDVRISTGSGDVQVVGYSRELIVRTGSGDVSLQESESVGDTFPDRPEVDIVTGSGDVALEISEQMALEISTGSGEIGIEGERIRSDAFTRNGSGGSIIVRTGSGDVDIVESAAL